MVYNYMMSWPFHCKIKDEPIHPKRNFTKYPFIMYMYIKNVYNNMHYDDHNVHNRGHISDFVIEDSISLT